MIVNFKRAIDLVKIYNEGLVDEFFEEEEKRDIRFDRFRELDKHFRRYFPELRVNESRSIKLDPEFAANSTNEEISDECDRIYKALGQFLTEEEIKNETLDRTKIFEDTLIDEFEILNKEFSGGAINRKFTRKVMPEDMIPDKMGQVFYDKYWTRNPKPIKFVNTLEEIENTGNERLLKYFNRFNTIEYKLLSGNKNIRLK